MILFSCDNKTENTEIKTDEIQSAGISGQSSVKDDESAKDVVKVAVGSPDHTTLVAAIKQASLVDALSNAGPFTVFAPTNAAFAKIPAATLADLMKEENKEKLIDILQYHVYVGRLSTDLMAEGQNLNQVNGGNIKVQKVNGKTTVNGANIIASVPASNGIVHVIDGVLLPGSN